MNTYRNISRQRGRHFLQIPGPTNVPDRILRAIDSPTIDHRGPEFARLGLEVLAKVKRVFNTQSHVIIYPSSGTGAWEAALTNTLPLQSKLLVAETGQFSSLWSRLAERLGYVVEMVPGDWRRGADLAAIGARLKSDRSHAIKAVCVVHNETSTGAISDVAGLRKILNEVDHPALLLVDAVSSLGSIEVLHDEWQADVTVSCSQKGLMLPPGLSFNAISPKAFDISRTANVACGYWDWQDIVAMNADGFWPTTPATNLLYGLAEACDMLFEEGLEAVYARHDRHAEATRRAVRGWGLEIQCQEVADYSPVLTGVRLPDGHNADSLRQLILGTYNLSLGTGLGKLAGRVFRIGHLGDFNDLMLLGTLAGVQMGLELAKVPHGDGLGAALSFLTAAASREIS